MRFPEYRAKALFARHGVPVPRGYVVSYPGEIASVEGPVVIKAQVLAGGRGKAGGIRFASDLEGARREASSVLGMTIGGYKVKQLLIEERLEIAQELYLGFVMDRTTRAVLMMASTLGGVDIESVPDGKIFRRHVPPFVGLQDYHIRAMVKRLGLQGDVARQVASVALAAHGAYEAEDAELLEINPLAVTAGGKVVAGDAKLTVDDNALYRHPEFQGVDQDLTPLEQEAKEEGIAFVQLDGDIGVIANGAGLTMATLDVLNLMGGRPGIFLDLGGTDDPEKVRQCLDLMRKARPRVIFLNIFGGITKCDTVAMGVKEALEAQPLGIPMVARIKGLNEDLAREILRGAGIVAETDFEAAARAAVDAGGS